MLVASSMGATAFQAGLGAMHALSHPLGALYDAHHGTLNAIVMPYVLKANRLEIEEKIIALSRFLDLDSPDFDGFLGWILDLRECIGIPNTLKEIGIGDEQLGLIGEMAIKDPTAATNPIAFSAQEYRDLCSSAIEGKL
jgi:hypothetical protein